MSSRRTFIQQAGAIASGAFLSPLLQPSRRYKLGLQLFTMRSAMSKDVEGTLKRVAAMGYEDFETYGFDPQGMGYYGLPAKTFAASPARSQAHDAQRPLRPESVHDVQRRRSESDASTAASKAPVRFGQTYIAWPLLDEGDRTIEKFKAAAGWLNVAGEQIKKAGLQLAYHNHDFEFVEQNGQIGYDIILKETDPALVKLQIDLLLDRARIEAHRQPVVQAGSPAAS